MYDMHCTGTENVSLMMIEVTRVKSAPQNLLVSDGRGKIVFATSSVAEILGYSHNQILTMDIVRLMPSPFNQLHVSWLKVGTSCPQMV
jgi:PAS domain S-box-containing protein